MISKECFDAKRNDPFASLMRQFSATMHIFVYK